MENWLLRTWYRTQRPPWYLRSLEPVYRALFQHAQKKGNTAKGRFRSRLPLIVVGNLTAGGSGKTPLIIRLCQLARELNLRPGIASTGYGRLGTDTIEVSTSGDARVCGDEPVMLAIRTGVPVIVAKSRVDAVRKLNELDLDVILSDDGLQQANMYRDIEFCVVDGARGLGNGHLLPAGPLREPARRLKTVDYVISNGIWSGKPDDLDVNVMQLEADQLYSLDGTKMIPAIQFRQMHKGKEIHAIAGIGNPQRFFDTIENLGIEAIPHRFPDHHFFSLADLSFLEADSALVMTEKDAVKCRSLGLENAWYVPVESRLPDDLERVFKDRLTKLIKERK